MSAVPRAIIDLSIRFLYTLFKTQPKEIDCLEEKELERIQLERFSEIILKCGGTGAALYVEQTGRYSLILHKGLSGALIDRLMYSAGQKERDELGLWFQKTDKDKTFHYFVKADDCPDTTRLLIGKYLVVWAELYK